MSDIVERLRNYTTCNDNDVDEAATEIERLRKIEAAARELFAVMDRIGEPAKTTEKEEAEMDAAVESLESALSPTTPTEAQR
jgi:hypothetical protein